MFKMMNLLTLLLEASVILTQGCVCWSSKAYSGGCLKTSFLLDLAVDNKQYGLIKCSI